MIIGIVDKIVSKDCVGGMLRRLPSCKALCVCVCVCVWVKLCVCSQ